MKFNRILIVLIAGVVLLSGSLKAGGTNYNSLYGARTLALNGLYIAGIDGLNSTFSNPASLSYLTGSSIRLTVADLLEQQEFNSTRNGLFNSYRNDNFNIGGGIYWNFAPGITAAVAYQPFVNYEVDWPYTVFSTRDSNAVILAFDLTNRQKVDAISPSVGVSFGTVSLGLSANIYHVQQFLAFPLQNNRPQGLAGYQVEYDEDAWAYGFTIGAMADLSENLRLGLMVRSAFKANLKGNAKSNMFAALDSAATDVNVASKFEMPWIMGLGAVYKLSQSVAVNVDLSYNLWGSTQKTTDFTTENQKWQNGLNQTDSLLGISPASFPVNLRNSLSAGVGFEISGSEEMSYRFGYRFSQSPNTAESYNMLTPGVSQHWFSFGIEYKDENYTVDAGIAYSVGVSREINNGAFSPTSGKYSSNNIVPAVSINYAF